MDVLEAKKGIKEADNSDILFFLIDLYKSVLFINLISFSISIFSLFTLLKNGSLHFHILLFGI